MAGITAKRPRPRKRPADVIAASDAFYGLSHRASYHTNGLRGSIPVAASDLGAKKTY